MFFKYIDNNLIRQCAITACLNLAELVNGYGVAWTAPVVPKLLDIEQTPLSHVISTRQVSWVATSMTLGIVGAYIASYAANKIGRRLCLSIGGIGTIVAYAILTAANNLSMIYAGRFLVGVWMSFSSLTIMIYIGEIASSNIRGKLLSSTGFFHAVGSLVVYCVGPYVSYAGVGYVAIGLATIFTVLTFFLPESPVYHVLKANEDAARASLIYLGRTKDIDSELKLMLEQVNETEKTCDLWRQILTVKSNRRSLFVTVPLFFFQQSSGIIAVVFFATTIFKDAGSSIEPHIATMIIGVTMVVGTIFSPIFVEKYGRKILLIISTSGCCVSLAALGSYFYFETRDHQAVATLGWFPLASLIVALFSYSVGFNVIPNTMSSEMFAPNVRGLGSSISLSTGWMSGFVSNNIFSYAVAVLGSDVTFWIFAAVDALALIFVLAFVPETKGKTLMEINLMMAN